MAEQKRNTRNTKSAKVQPVNDYGRIQPQAPELEEAVLGALMIEKDAYSFEIEQQLLEQFLRNTWKNMDEEHKQEFLHAVDARVNELEELLPLLMKDKLLAKGVSHLLSSQLTRILRTHAAMSVLGHGLLRGAGLGGPVGAALNGVKAVSGSAYRVTIPAVLQIACLRRMVSATQV